MLMLLYCQELKGKKILDERQVINSDNQASLRLAQKKKDSAAESIILKLAGL